MEIIIDQNKALREIQKEFSKHYPFLKIEFFKEGHARGELTSKKDLLNNKLTVGEVQPVTNTGIVRMNGHMKIAELEKEFSDLGLPVQVFYKSKEVWLQTGVTDHRTLTEQNKRAMEMNSPDTSIPEVEDYHEQE